MMSSFLENNRAELITRCSAKVAMRPKRTATTDQLKNGIPMFLDQLTKTLQAEDADDVGEGIRISGKSGGDGLSLSEVGTSATAHGRMLLQLGYTVDQVVHDYGDLCQAITDLAFERDAPFSIDEFRTLNRCLDNAIADAVTEFSFERDASIALKQSSDANERLGYLMHELRNSLGSASLAVIAMELGNLTISGSTGAVLKRSHSTMAHLIERSLKEVRTKNELSTGSEIFSLAEFIADAEEDALLFAHSRGATLEVKPVDTKLALEANRESLQAALTNLLNNAFKFTHAHTLVTLSAYEFGNRILIDVADQCGGLPPGNAEKMFTPFMQSSGDRSGLGLGLSIARQSVEADGGVLTVRDVPGIGCIFTINLPRIFFQ
jgi:signal transduction histidine kinase